MKLLTVLLLAVSLYAQSQSPVKVVPHNDGRTTSVLELPGEGPDCNAGIAQLLALPYGAAQTSRLCGKNGDIVVPTGNLGVGTTVVCAVIGVNAGTSYTLTGANNGCVLTFNNAAAITLTVPAGLPVGFSCLIVQLGAGAVTPTASGTTILQRQSFTKTAGQYAVATLLSHVANAYLLAGDLQ